MLKTSQYLCTHALSLSSSAIFTHFVAKSQLSFHLAALIICSSGDVLLYICTLIKVVHVASYFIGHVTNLKFQIAAFKRKCEAKIFKGS